MNWKELETKTIGEFAVREVIIQKLVGDEWVGTEEDKASMVYDVVNPTVTTRYRYKLISEGK